MQVARIFKLHIDLIHSSDSSNNQTDNFVSETINLTFQEVIRQRSTWFRSHNIIFVTVSTSLPNIWRVYSSKFSCSGFSVLTLDDRVEQNIKEMYCHLLDCRLDTVCCFEFCDTHEVHQTFLSVHKGSAFLRNLLTVLELFLYCVL